MPQKRTLNRCCSILFRTPLIAFLSLAVVSCSSLGKSSRKYYSRHPARAYAIVDVNLINMEMDLVLKHQTVIVEDETISKIGPSDEINLPPDAQIIPGSGKYLLPGFIDMHVHISDESDLLKFLKHGVTTVRHMSDVPRWAKAMGFPDALSLRKKLSRIKIIGPDIYAAGYTLDGDPAVSPMNKKITSQKDAEKEIKREKEAGYDYIKIYDNLTPEIFDAILSAARAHDIPVVGHVPFEVGIDAALQSSVHSIEHLTGYINNNAGTFIIPEDKIEYYAKTTEQSGIYNCPTLVIWDNLPPEDQIEQLENDPEYQYVSWRIRWLWRKSLSYVYDITYPDRSGYAAHMMEISKTMLMALYNAGSPLILGTDANFVGVYPGISALREMELMGEAGMSNMDILRAATSTAAKALGTEGEIGTIVEGKRANMVLLEGDPLQEIDNVYRTYGVFIRGRWMTREEIEDMLEDIY